MPLHIKVAGQPDQSKTTTVINPGAAPDFDLDEIIHFGKLDIPVVTIAKFYGLSKSRMLNYMQRTDMRKAYERGRAETVIAARQTQLARGLAPVKGTKEEPGIGSDRMLIYIGEHFADQEGSKTVEDFEDKPTNDRSWGTALSKRAEKIRETLLTSKTEAE